MRSTPPQAMNAANALAEEDQHPDADNEFAPEQRRAGYMNPGERTIKHHVAGQNGQQQNFEHMDASGFCHEIDRLGSDHVVTR